MDAAALAATATGLAAAAGVRLAVRRGWRAPWLTLGATSAVIAGLAAQGLWPGLLPAAMRDPAAVADGEVWRLASSLLLQDGGAAGALWNILGLAVLGTIAEAALTRRDWALAALAGALAGGLAGTALAVPGAGNSILVLGLGGALLARSLRSPGPARWLGLAGLGCGLVLAAMRDIHGAAVVAGALVGIVTRET